MLRMVLKTPRTALVAEACADPEPGPGELRLRVRACGVCRTDLHVVDGDLGDRGAPVVPGHEIVGVVDALGGGVTGVAIGERRGVPWLGGTCGVCRYCREGQENLCDNPTFTGWTRDGGYADTVIARADFTFALPEGLSDLETAPLLCAGLIGFRAWRMACAERKVERLGLYGFGAAAHLLAQLAIHQGQTVYAFTREGDEAAQALARQLGCVWTGGSGEPPPEPLDAAILFAPVGDLVPLALAAVRKGGTVVCGGIHMSDIPSFPYDLLWGERRLLSVANLTRQDARDYLPMAAAARVRAHVRAYRLDEANAALDDLRRGAFAGAAVLAP
ncbi:MAG: zinc-binding alcohol dehydrogenase family protein [Phenylobacterium sp.]|uniref:zinc-dependent alcohol dehydrogenase family protein n=1 Tax=Phenylobacterium sp. TaxID=1871053 RepID=UPI00121B388E|nr:zinc-dependent alcohol dehydrogenase family protein [Phenylobacterium sp.]TAJ69824.1 MAG: zinc-binding alcohol dehydrogenase family protein [Phenylobacterium sp.]